MLVLFYIYILLRGHRCIYARISVTIRQVSFLSQIFVFTGFEKMKQREKVVADATARNKLLCNWEHFQRC